MTRWIVHFALLLVFSAFGLPASAHDQGSSYSRWTLGETDVRVEFRITRRQLTRLPVRPPLPLHAGSPVVDYLLERLTMRVDGKACSVRGSVRRLPSDRTRVAYAWRLFCPDGDPWSLESRLFGDRAPHHLHFATVVRPDGTLRQYLLTSGQPRRTIRPPHTLPDSPAGWIRFAGRYLRVGIHHVLRGWDHLAFVLGLVLIVGSGRQIVRDVTGFTVGHSLTLGLATYGVAHPSIPLTEALIALSVIFIGLENLWLAGDRPPGIPRTALGVLGLLGGLSLLGVGRLPVLLILGSLLFFACYFEGLRRHRHPERLRFWLAGLFGLVHGFGFAGRLNEPALPAGRRLAALLGFNTGVEVGQLLFVAALVLLYAIVRRTGLPLRRRWIVEAGSTLVVAAGVHWFVLRGFGV